MTPEQAAAVARLRDDLAVEDGTGDTAGSFADDEQAADVRAVLAALDRAEAEVARLREALARARGYESAEHFDTMMAAFKDQRPSGQEGDRGE